MTPQQANKLLDTDGENLAVRSFLAQYSCDRSITVGAMLAHMSHSGWRGTAPQEILDYRPESPLTKADAADWIRHLFSLECRAPAPTEPAVDRDARNAQRAIADIRRFVNESSDKNLGMWIDDDIDTLTAYLATPASPAVPAVPAGDDFDSLIYPPKAMLKREDWDATTRKPRIAVQAVPEPAPLAPLPKLPNPLVVHPVIGDMFDRMQMHQYAMKYAHPPQVAQASQPTSAEAVAIAKPVMYQQRIIAPNGNIGTWYEVEASVYRRYAANSDAGDGFRFEGRALYLQPTSAEGKDSERLEATSPTTILPTNESEK